MSKLLAEIDLNKYRLFHMRYGRGAVIVAVSLNMDSDGNRINSDKYVAQVYAAGESTIATTPTPLDPIISISENEDFIKMMIEVRRVHSQNPSYNPIDAIVERILPITQVTLEIIRNNKSMRPSGLSANLFP